MIGFLNERSLEEHCDWVSTLRLFFRVAQELQQTNAVLLRDSRFFVTAYFKQRFNSLSFPVDQRAVVRQLAFSDRYYRCWREEQISDADTQYQCADPLCEPQDESLGEATERKLAQAEASVTMFSAPDSAFGRRCTLNLRKSSAPSEVSLDNASSLESVTGWIARQRGFYDAASAGPPRDFQTILEAAPVRFHRTGKVERHGNRRIFEERETRRLFYVDDAHVGHAAHLEVFSANGDHLGVADIATGTLNADRHVAGRVLKL